MFKKIMQHKAKSVFVLCIAAIAGYYGYQAYFAPAEPVRYVLATVENGTLVVSVSGTGQVLASNQIDIKPKVAGDIVSVRAAQGQEVKEGDVLAALDATDAEKSLKDAKTTLETAQLELEKLLAPVDELTLLQAEHAMISANESKQNAEENLAKAYEDGFNAVSNTFLELPDLMTGLYNIMFANTLSDGKQWNIDYYSDTTKVYDETVLQYRAEAFDAHQIAKQSYDASLIRYKATSRFSENKTIEELIAETYDTSKNISEAIKKTNNLIQFYREQLINRNFTPISASNTHLSSLNTYTGKTNGYLSTLLSLKSTIQSSKDSIVSSGRSIRERELSLQNVKDGPDDLAIRAKRITVQQKEDALEAARQTLADHAVRAPFAGVVAAVKAKKGDSVSVGTIIATLITKQKMAEISLNEVDVAQIETGQKATLSFDAVPDIVLTGQVAEIDTIGTSSQGVVTYMVKIAFDTEDERVKTAMTVSANIIIKVKTDVLLAPNAAVKTQGHSNYVDVVEGGNIAENDIGNTRGAVLSHAPEQKTVRVGISNNESTEILDGLREGSIVIIRTIKPGTQQASTTSQQGGIRIPGFGGSR